MTCGFDSGERTTRRQLLTAVTTGLGGSLAGCAGFGGGDGSNTNTTTSHGTTGIGSYTELSLAEQGFPKTVCSEDVVPAALAEIDDPAYASDWSTHEVRDRYGPDGRIGESRTVVGLEHDGQARAYPLSILWYHEVVDDWLGDLPVLVTYCPICKSGLVADRRIDGQDGVTNFQATGLLWRPPGVQAGAAEDAGRAWAAAVNDSSPDQRIRVSGNLVMADDATGSYWSQLLGQAICGPLEGRRLDIVPSTITDWGTWRREQPKTDVLLPPPHSGTRAP
ncbi:DUF3179 domain-containing (seleno)protein [Haloarchaeobius sp. DYHT-AS-18]|uniref:DUF3179 domain-containing (seleno)protein n=1 Tax=Haloarchaeobius sp. DYHT-AS-18 TaxID=3446117 RepID=UPI003EC139D8